MHTIRVKDIIGTSYASATEHGDLLFQKVDSYFKSDEEITLDFDEIDIIVSTFLNASIGQLYGFYSSDFIKNHLKVKNMSNDDLNVLRKVIERAREYFKDKDGFEEIVKRDI